MLASSMGLSLPFVLLKYRNAGVRSETFLAVIENVDKNSEKSRARIVFDDVTLSNVAVLLW